MAGLPLSSMSSSSSLVVVLPAASDTTQVSHEPPCPSHRSRSPTTGFCWLHGISREWSGAKLPAPRAHQPVRGAAIPQPGSVPALRPLFQQCCTRGSDQGGARNLEPGPDLHHKCVSAPGRTVGGPAHPAMRGHHPTGMVHAATLPGEFLQQQHLHTSLHISFFARSCTWVGATPRTSTDWGMDGCMDGWMDGWRAALRRRTGGFWWVTNGT